MNSDKRAGLMTIRHSSLPHGLRSRSSSPLLSSSSAEIEQHEYPLAKELQDGQNRLQCQEERTLQAAEIEDRTNSISRVQSCNQFAGQRQPISEQEVSHDFSSISDEDKKGDADYNDDCDENENKISESGECVLEAQNRNGVEVPNEGAVPSSEEEHDGDEEAPDEDDVEIGDGDPTSDANSGIETIIPYVIDVLDSHSTWIANLANRLRSFGERLSNILQEMEQLQSMLLDEVTEDDVEPDHTVIRSADFGRCTICFEDIPYDPVGCLYCQQMIGCRRCVSRWYRGVRYWINSEDDPMGAYVLRRHKMCPLCRHEWEDEMEVTSMFDLCDR